MKGIIVTLPRKSKRKERVKPHIHAEGFLTYLKRYGVIIFYVLCFASGMLFGTVSVGRVGENLMNSLDFLFTTNLSARLSQPMYMTFVSGLSSNFLFFLAAFLLGLSLWGMAPLFFMPLFKGFGTGLSAGYLLLNFGLKGIGFYLLVILPGTFLFTFSLVMISAESHKMSFRLMHFFLFDKAPKSALMLYLRSYLLRSFFLFVLTVVSALCDMLLWSFFAKLFF